MNALPSRRVAGLALLLPILFGSFCCGDAKEWQPPEELISTWFARAEVFAPFKKDEYPSRNPEDWIPISMTIHADGSVDGSIGNVRLSGCRIEKNRGWLGKKLNLKTDYIIRGGTLEGGIVAGDQERSRKFTIPFNIVDGRLKGSFMVLRSWKSPLPMFPRLALEKATRDQPDNPALSSLIEAERSFAKTSLEKGIRETFLTFLADEAIVFRPHAVSGKKWYQDRPASSGVLSWEPAFADVAASGDFGYTTGPWEYKQARTDSQSVAFGHFVSVWKKQANGEWRVVIDVGIEHAHPANRPAKVETAAKRIKAEAELAGGTNVSAERENLLQTDREFSNRSAANGFVSAFQMFAANDVRLYRPQLLPVVGKETARSALSEKPCRLTWQPIAGDVSVSGDLGYTYGTSTCESGEATHRSSYMRIWRKEAGGWRVVLDIENPWPDKEK